MNNSGAFVTVAICKDPGEAQLLSGMLEDAGIPHQVAGEHASGIFGASLATRIQVPEVNAEDARALLSEVDASLHGAAPDHDAADPRVAEGTARESRRRNNRLLLFFLLLLFVLAFRTFLRFFD